MVVVMRPVIRAAHRATQYHLTSPQIQLLQFLESKGPLTMSEISARLEMTLAGASSLARRMEKTQWIERQRSSEDRRVVRLALTDDGNALLERMERARNEVLAAQFAKLDANEIHELERLCRKMLD